MRKIQLVVIDAGFALNGFNPESEKGGLYRNLKWDLPDGNDAFIAALRENVTAKVWPMLAKRFGAQVAVRGAAVFVLDGAGSFLDDATRMAWDVICDLRRKALHLEAAASREASGVDGPHAETTVNEQVPAAELAEILRTWADTLVAQSQELPGLTFRHTCFYDYRSYADLGFVAPTGRDQDEIVSRFTVMVEPLPPTT